MNNIHISTRKKIQIEVLKNDTKNRILEVFPIERQLSYQNDVSYSQGAISGLKSISYDTITNGCAYIVGMTENIEELKSIFKNINNLDISLINTEKNCDEYYRTIIKSILVYRMIRICRDWSNKKEIEIENCKTHRELDLINLKDYPKL